MSGTPIFDELDSYRKRNKYQHTGLDCDFGYCHCSCCRGDWEGPEDPEDSPCEVEAQAIRNVRETWEYWMESGQFDQADSWMGLFSSRYPAFDESGGLKDAYWC